MPARPSSDRRNPARYGRDRAGTGRARTAATLAGLLGLAGLFLLGLGAARGFGPPGPGEAAQHGLFTSHPARPLNRSVPVRIGIAAIGVLAPVQAVGLSLDGAIATPQISRPNLAGWYDLGPTPGQAGVAVIVGHVDTRRGPSVFYHLGQLQPGQYIEVSRADHRVARFRVDAVRRYPKDAVPQAVWSDQHGAGLRVITCGGSWAGGRVGYTDNVVVFATLTG